MHENTQKPTKTHKDSGKRIKMMKRTKKKHIISYKSTARHSAHGTRQQSATQQSAAQRSTLQHSTAQHSTAQPSTTQRSTAQPGQQSVAQQSAAQRNAAQHSTAQHSICVALYGQTANCGHMCRVQRHSKREDINKIKSENSTGETITDTCVAHNVSPKQHEEIAKII